MKECRFGIEIAAVVFRRLSLVARRTDSRVCKNEFFTLYNQDTKGKKSIKD